MLTFFLIQIHILITLESWVKEMKHGIITKVVQDLGIHILSEIQSLVARAQAILEDCRLIIIIWQKMLKIAEFFRS